MWLLALAGVDTERPKAKRTKAAATPRLPYTVERYAAEKRLDAEALRAWGCESKRYRDTSWVAIPYKDVSGTVTAVTANTVRCGTSRLTRSGWYRSNVRRQNA